MITHNVVTVDSEFVSRALFQVIIMDNLEISVFFAVLAKQEIAVMATPDLMEHRSRSQDIFSWNSHAEK